MTLPPALPNIGYLVRGPTADRTLLLEVEWRTDAVTERPVIEPVYAEDLTADLEATDTLVDPVTKKRVLLGRSGHYTPFELMAILHGRDA